MKYAWLMFAFGAMVGAGLTLALVERLYTCP